MSNHNIRFYGQDDSNIRVTTTYVFIGKTFLMSNYNIHFYGQDDSNE